MTMSTTTTTTSSSTPLSGVQPAKRPISGHHPLSSHCNSSSVTTPNPSADAKPSQRIIKIAPIAPPKPILRREASLAIAAAALTPLFAFPPAIAAQDTQASSAPQECPLAVAPSGLAFCDRVIGTGQPATKGLLIKAHYLGRLENGKVFDSSYSRGRPLSFRVGVGEVIKGWDQGILGGDGVPPMLAGGKRALKLPPGLAYGARGAGCNGGSCIIPPDSTLLFEVEFIGKA